MGADILFVARKKGERPVEKWVTAKDAKRLLPIYEKDGWTVTTKLVQ